MATYWSQLKVDTISDPEYVTLYVLLSILPLIMKAAFCKLSMASWAPLLQDATQTGSSMYPIYCTE